MKTLIWGHRGARAHCPENTLLAFETAFDQGADGIEIDIHYSKDGDIVIFHDFDLEPLTGAKGMIYEKTLAQLKALSIKHKTEGHGIPTLEEALKLIERKSIELNRPLWLNVELKAGSQLYKGIEQRAKSLCEAYLPKERVIYSSFDHFSLQTLKKIDPDCLTGVLTAEAMVDPWLYTAHIHGDFYHPHFMALNQEVLNSYKANGLFINPYTVNDPNIALLLYKNGSFGIITDDPQEIIKTLEGEGIDK